MKAIARDRLKGAWQVRHAWMLYAGVLVVFALGRLVQKISTETGGFGSRYGPLLVVAIIALGLWGAVYRRPVMRPWIWKAVFGLLAFASVGAFGFVVYWFFAADSGAFKGAGLILVLLLVLIPAQRQLFRYAFRSVSLWQGQAHR